ncbi:M48 family metalloprotease [Flexivirga sp. B27]
MLALLACMTAGILCATAGPWLLRGMKWQVARPAVALRLWFGLFAAGLAALLGSVVVAIVLATTASERSGGVAATSAVLSGWLFLLALGASIGLVGHHAGPVVEGRRSGGLSLLVLVARDEIRRTMVAGSQVCVVEAPTAFAVAGRGCDVDIVVSRPLEAALSADELRAVVEHEAGHLRGGHAMLRTVSLVASAIAPKARCGKDFAHTVHLLTELAADDHAASRCGVDVTASALRTVSDMTGAPGPSLRAQRLSRRAGPVAG